jgi:hypothetical protein
MAVAVYEKPNSRRFTRGENPGLEVEYVVEGATTQLAASDAVAGFTPTKVDIWGDGWLYVSRTSWTVDQQSPTGWVATVAYGRTPSTEETEEAFDTTGETQHITQSMVTWPGSPSAPDCKGVIGAGIDSIDGCDIVVPSFRYTLTKWMSPSRMTTAYKRMLFWLTGCVNGSEWKLFGLGEALYMGARARRRGWGDWEVQHEFRCRPNRTDVKVGPFQQIRVGGWQYLDVRYRDTVVGTGSAAMLTKTPMAVWVHQVYRVGNFSQLGV